VPNKFSKQRRYYTRKMVPEVKDLTEEEASYIAGLVDADGHIGLYEQKYGYTTIVSIGSANEDLIRWLKKTVGDMSVTKLNPNPGRIKDCNHTKPMYRFNILAQIDVKKVLEEITPYLTIKKPEAEVMLKYLKGKLRGKEAVKQMRKEKQKRKGRNKKKMDEKNKKENKLTKFL